LVVRDADVVGLGPTLVGAADALFGGAVVADGDTDALVQAPTDTARTPARTASRCAG